MAECPTCHTPCPDAARFCPACGQALTALPPVLADRTPPTVATLQADTAAAVPAAPLEPSVQPKPPRGSLRWGWWLLGSLFTLLLGLMGGGWLWLEHTVSAPLPAPASPAAAPAAPIELAPGLTLQERRPAETPSPPAAPATPVVSASPAPAPAATPASVAPLPAPPATPPLPAVSVAPAKPALAASPVPASPDANRRQTPAPPSQTFQPPPESSTPPAVPAPVPAAAPARANPQPNTQALHDDILRRKEALKQQMGVE